MLVEEPAGGNAPGTRPERNADDARLEGAVVVRPEPEPGVLHHAVVAIIPVFRPADDAVVVNVHVETEQLEVDVADFLAAAAGRIVIAVDPVCAHGASDSDRTFLGRLRRFGSDLRFGNAEFLARGLEFALKILDTLL